MAQADKQIERHDKRRRDIEVNKATFKKFKLYEDFAHCKKCQLIVHLGFAEFRVENPNRFHKAKVYLP